MVTLSQALMDRVFSSLPQSIAVVQASPVRVLTATIGRVRPTRATTTRAISNSTEALWTCTATAIVTLVNLFVLFASSSALALYQVVVKVHLFLLLKCLPCLVPCY